MGALLYKGTQGHCDKDPLFGCLIGASPSMRKVFTQIEKISPNDLPVFITGETGTGKEKTAEAIHKYSSHSNGAFVPFHCGGYAPEMIDSALFGHKKGAFTGAQDNRNGAIKQAEGGTLFLDDICDMPRELQLKILRFTQNYTYQPLGDDPYYKANLRIICATRRDPAKYVEDKKFRKDLFYRLYVQPVHLPPLKNRGNDIIDLALFFINQKKASISFSPEAKELLKKYKWSGNVRELKNLIDLLIAQTNQPIINTSDLPDYIAKTKNISQDTNLLSARMPLKHIEKTVIENTIHYCHGDIVRAAAILEIAPSTIYRKKAQWEKWS